MNLANFEILNPKEEGIAEQNGAIRVATNTGWMWGKGNVCQNLLLQPTSINSGTVEISLELLPIQNGEQIGIVFYIDSDNYIKFVREMVDDKHVLVLAKEIDGKPKVEMLLPFESAQANLKLMLAENVLTASWKDTDEASHQEKRFPNWFPERSLFRVGVLVHGNTANNQATVNTFIVNGERL